MRAYSWRYKPCAAMMHALLQRFISFTHGERLLVVSTPLWKTHGGSSYTPFKACSAKTERSLRDPLGEESHQAVILHAKVSCVVKLMNPQHCSAHKRLGIDRQGVIASIR